MDDLGTQPRQLGRDRPLEPAEEVLDQVALPLVVDEVEAQARAPRLLDVPIESAVRAGMAGLTCLNGIRLSG